LVPHELRPFDDSTLSDQSAAPGASKMKKSMLRTTSTASNNADTIKVDPNTDDVDEEEKVTTTASTSLAADPVEGRDSKRKKKVKK
jgi:hypothetical protein